jgi:hypothetical protein
MMPIDILDLQEHKNPRGAPYTVAIVDDPNDGKTKVVIVFAGHGDVAVLLLDRLIESESIDEDPSASTNADELARVVRAAAISV